MCKFVKAELRQAAQRPALIAGFLLCGFLHAATLPAPNSTWRYLKGSTEASSPDNTAWRLPGFNDASWLTGATPLRTSNIGSGGTQLNDMVNGYSCVFMRQTFTLTANDIATIPQLMASVDYDDGFIIWINGVEVRRKYAPTPNPYNAIAPAQHDSGIAELFDLPPPPEYLVVGTNVMAVQAFNFARSNGDFLINPGLLLSNGKVGDTQFSHTRGFFSAPINLAITSATPGAIIRYTTDGSLPSPTSGTTYLNPIPISVTTTIRAIATKSGMAPSNVDTQTYIFTASVKTQTRPPSYTTTWSQGTTTADYDMDTKVTNNAIYTNRIDPALKDLPSLSIVMHYNDIFATTGIYQNTNLEGPEWERPCSLELIYPDGTAGFQINCGASIQGGASRNPPIGNTGTSKHSFRLLFKDFWGPSKLKFPLLGPGVNTSFDTVILRSVYNNNWPHWDAAQRSRGQLIHDQFGRELQLQTGTFCGHGQFQHLYVNGLYWGIYIDHERPDAAFASTYYGGNRSDWDAVNAGVIVDGDPTAFNALFALVNSFPQTPGTAQNTQYQSLKQYLDIDNLIDYLIVNHYCGNTDWDNSHNWYGARKRESGAGWKFLCWDIEHILENLGDNSLTINNASAPTQIFQKLRFSADFRMRYADHAHKHLTRNGCMTPNATAARYKALSDKLDKAIVAESARWGDARTGGGFAFMRDTDWVNERTRLIGNPITIPPQPGAYFAQRTTTVLNQMRTPPNVLGDTNSLYPFFEPPNFSVESGNIPAGGLTLNLTNVLGNPTTNFVMYYTLDGSDPRVVDSVNGPGGAVLPTALNGGLNKTLTITQTTTVRARYLQGTSTWSALHEATYFGSQNLGALKITEVMYHPIPLSVQPEEKFEFIEMKNTGAQPLVLSGVQLWGKASDPVPLYSFPTGFTLNPGQFHVLVYDQAQFRARYPLATYPASAIGGVYGTDLDNGGQILSLKSAGGTAFFSMTFNDKAPWPSGGDGNGFSIVPIDPNINPDPNNAVNWRSSANAGGSPGTDDPLPPPFPTVVINEVLTNSTLPQIDKIELYNLSTFDAQVGNWYLTDDHNTPKKFKIPAGTMIPAGSFISFNESQFNPQPPTAASFLLSSHGEEVYLFSADAAGNLTGYSDGFTFKDSEADVSFGRYEISTGEIQYPAQIAKTFDAANSGPRIGPVVISEILYFPITDQSEFVELKNITPNPVNLFDPNNPSNTWRINGVGLNFPPNTVIPPNGLIIATALDPVLFRTKYNVPAAVQIFGPFLGNLQDDGEMIELQKPDVPYLDANNVLQIPYVTVDAVRYSNIAPWPTASAGGGYTLERIDTTQYGNDPINWRAGALLAGSPGRFHIATWSGAADGINWNNAGNWNNAPFSSNYTVLNFPDVGAAPYIATNDFAGTFSINKINLNSSLANAIAGGAIAFQGVSPTLAQNGSAAFTISNAITLAADTTAGGSGSGTVSLTGALSGAGGLLKNGPSTLILSGANTYLGTTLVNGGTMQFDGSLTAPAGTVTVSAGASLRGDGTINGPVVIAGTTSALAPGSTSGVAAVKGTLTASSVDFSSGVLRIRASNTVVGVAPQCDKLVLTAASAAILLGGSSKLELTLSIEPGVYTNQYSTLLQTTGGALIQAKFASAICVSPPNVPIGGPGNPQFISVVYLANSVEVDPAVTPADTIALKVHTIGTVPPTITSANHVTFTAGSPGMFTVTTTGTPAPQINRSGVDLPAGVTFVSNGDGTGTLSGTAAPGTGGVYSFQLTASNGTAQNDTQNFTLTVEEAPLISSAGSATFETGVAGSFTVTAVGFPAAALAVGGTLPAGVMFTDNTDGTATLAGTPAANSGGVYPLTLTAANGIGTSAMQNFMLTVNEKAGIVSGGSATFTVGQAGTFTIATAGFPAPAIALYGPTLPAGLSFLDNGDGTATLSGTPAAATGGVRILVVGANNGIGSEVAQDFMLTINQAPGISAADSAVFKIGKPASFNLTATGHPKPLFSLANGTLPTGLTFVDNGNATGTLSGTAAAGTTGDYALTFSAQNGVGDGASKAVTITVKQPPELISAPVATPNPAGLRQTVSFTAAALGTNLAYAWDFGDGATGSDAATAHQYATSGEFTATVTVSDGVDSASGSVVVTVTALAPIVGSGMDSDSDGFSDDFETTAGSGPLDGASTPTGTAITGGAVTLLSVTKASIKLNFAKLGADSIQFSGFANIPANFVPLGQRAILDFGGVTKSFTLDTKGSAKSGNDTLKIGIKAKKGIVASQLSTFTASFKKGSFAAQLADENLTGATTVSKVPRNVRITMIFNSGVSQKTQTLIFSVKAFKTGSAK